MPIHLADNYCHRLTLSDTGYPAILPGAGKNSLFSPFGYQSVSPEVATEINGNMGKSYLKSSCYCLQAERVDLVPGD